MADQFRARLAAGDSDRCRGINAESEHSIWKRPLSDRKFLYNLKNI